MKLDRRQESETDRQHLCDALSALREGCRNRCAPCEPCCPRPQDRRCSPFCPEMREALSSDPANEPLEAGIAPLVYQLKKLGVFQPFWSCEGHYGPDGDLWKSPRVWFFSNNVVHTRVLAEVLSELRLRNAIVCRWQVALAFCEPHNSGAAFALEPMPDERASLGQLQSDARRIARSLPDMLEEQITRIERALKIS